MSPLDVSDVLQDPDFRQNFTVTRTTESVDEHGRTQEQVTMLAASGAIVPATPKQLERMPEADRSSQVIAVYSSVQLTPGSPTLKPDVVTWRGQPYTVVSLDDFSDYGGWCVALCANRNMQGREPE